MPADKRLEFGWFLPTAGDTTAYGLANAQVAPSLELFDKVVGRAIGKRDSLLQPTGLGKVPTLSTATKLAAELQFLELPQTTPHSVVDSLCFHAFFGGPLRPIWMYAKHARSITLPQCFVVQVCWSQFKIIQVSLLEQNMYHS